MTRTGGFADQTFLMQVLLVVLIAAFSLVMPANRQALAAPEADAAHISVVVTIKPLHALVSKVLNGVTTPKLLISGAQSPHHFALKPSDARALHRAQTFVRVGADLEPFTKKLIASLPKSVSVVTVTQLAGLERHPVREDDAFESHDHHHGHHESHQDDKDHHHGDAHHDHDEPGGQAHYDPHIWLDPKNAAVIVKAVAQHFSNRLPKYKDRITQNASDALVELTLLEADMMRTLGPVKESPFLVFHDAFQYFEKRFDLTGVGAITLHPEAPPSAKRMIEIRQILKQRKVRCVFAEPQFSQKRLANIVEGTSAKVGTLDPLGSDVVAGANAYGAILRKLANNFSACFTQS